jgi:hypothetical protein
MTAPIRRVTFLGTRLLAAYACDELPSYMLAYKPQMFALAASVGSAAALAELMDARGCTAGADPYARACFTVN